MCSVNLLDEYRIALSDAIRLIEQLREQVVKRDERISVLCDVIKDCGNDAAIYDQTVQVLQERLVSPARLQASEKVE